MQAHSKWLVLWLKLLLLSFYFDTIILFCFFPLPGCKNCAIFVWKLANFFAKRKQNDASVGNRAVPSWIGWSPTAVRSSKEVSICTIANISWFHKHSLNCYRAPWSERWQTVKRDRNQAKNQETPQQFGATRQMGRMAFGWARLHCARWQSRVSETNVSLSLQIRFTSILFRVLCVDFCIQLYIPDKTPTQNYNTIYLDFRPRH